MKYYFMVDEFNEMPGATVSRCYEVREADRMPADGVCKNKDQARYWVRENRLSPDVAAFYERLAAKYYPFPF